MAANVITGTEPCEVFMHRNIANTWSGWAESESAYDSHLIATYWLRLGRVSTSGERLLLDVVSSGLAPTDPNREAQLRLA